MLLMFAELSLFIVVFLSKRFAGQPVCVSAACAAYAAAKSTVGNPGVVSSVVPTLLAYVRLCEPSHGLVPAGFAGPLTAHVPTTSSFAIGLAALPICALPLVVRLWPTSRLLRIFVVEPAAPKSPPVRIGRLIVAPPETL